MLSEAQRRMLKRVAEGEQWFDRKTHRTVSSLEHRGLVTAKREWRFGNWQYLVRITEAGRKALDG